MQSSSRPGRALLKMAGEQGPRATIEVASGADDLEASLWRADAEPTAQSVIVS